MTSKSTSSRPSKAKSRVSKKKKPLAFIWRFIKYFLVFFFGSSIFFVILYRFVNPPVTPLMLIRSVEQVFDGEKPKLAKQWMPMEKISENLQIAAIVAEDDQFMSHHGFDLDAIEKAQEHNKKTNGKRIRGASTISQQTAKNVFLWPQRSWLRKGLEAYFTVLIEFTWPKKRILEVYLNVIEMGDGLYGAEKASQTYFRKPASALSRSDAALLVAIFPSPLTMNPAHPTPYLLRRESSIIQNMQNYGKLEY